ncbi:MAG: stage V sporulation protein AB [Lachnospiraceae bacterium]
MKLMWIKWCVLTLLGWCAGMTVAGGVFALLIALGMISRLAYRTNTGNYILFYEHAVSLGAIAGSLWQMFFWRLPVGRWGLAAMGLFFGIFVGVWIMTLTEIIDTIPIFMRRAGLKRGLALFILAMALGYAAGMLFYSFK